MDLARDFGRSIGILLKTSHDVTCDLIRMFNYTMLTHDQRNWHKGPYITSHHITKWCSNLLISHHTPCQHDSSIVSQGVDSKSHWKLDICCNRHSKLATRRSLFHHKVFATTLLPRKANQPVCLSMYTNLLIPDHTRCQHDNLISLEGADWKTTSSNYK